jgi:stromal membrane-associated protein
MVQVSPPMIQTAYLESGEESMMIELTPKASEREIQAKLKKRIKILLRKSENKECADCSKPNPKWAILLTVPSAQGGLEGPYAETFRIGGLCCIECSGAHRRLGTHLSFVRSVDLDTLKETEIKALEHGGNSAVNDIFEGIAFDRSVKIDPTSCQKVRETFIRSKYEKKKYLGLKSLAIFRQKMIYRGLHTHSPQSAQSPLSFCSSRSSTCSPSIPSPQQQLQIFTSSPRTLALIEKYMNPKKKKKGLRRMKFSFKKLSRKSRFKGDVRNMRGLVNVNPNLNVVETRSECDISPKNDLDDDNSVSSARSSMSAKIRRNLIQGKKMLTPTTKDFPTPWRSTPTSTSSLNTPRRKKFFGKKSCVQNLTDEPEEFESKKEGCSPSPASSTDSSRKFRFSNIIRTPRRSTPKRSSKGSGKKKKKKKNGDYFFSEDGGLNVVREVGSSDLSDNAAGKDEEMKALRAWSKTIDNAMSKFLKKRKVRKREASEDDATLTLLQCSKETL